MKFSDIKDIYSKVIDTFKSYNHQQKLKVPADVLGAGWKLSKMVMADDTEIHLTPVSKNMLKRFCKGKDRLMAADKLTRLDHWIDEQTIKILNKFTPINNKDADYDMDNMLSSYNYNVDCWRNFKPDGGWRHIIPDMNKARRVNFEKFIEPFSNIWWYPPIENGAMLALDKGLEILTKCIPTVSSSATWVDVNDIFKSKHTNVGYPYFKNDKAKTPEGKTYGELVDSIAQTKSPREVANYPFIAFGRNQRQKARPILGGSRIQALVYNQLEAQEIEAYKEKSLLFSGYKSRSELKPILINMAEYCIKHGLVAQNRDYSEYDTTVTPFLKLLITAFNIKNTTDERGKDIALWRGISTIHSHMINGLWSIRDNPIDIYGRIFSGEIDTNAGGGKINALVTLSSMIACDKTYDTIANDLIDSGTPPLLVMGDDNLIIENRNLDQSNYIKYVKKTYGLNISQTKGEFGIFFLQNRLIKKNNNYMMITPFTRIIRSILNKERPVGLGPAGWTLAYLQLLSYLLEWPELMIEVARVFILPFDDHKLFLNLEWKQLTKLVGEEDQAAQGDRFISTYDKLFDGDPQKRIDWNSEDNDVVKTFETLKHHLFSKARTD